MWWVGTLCFLRWPRGRTSREQGAVGGFFCCFFDVGVRKFSFDLIGNLGFIKQGMGPLNEIMLNCKCESNDSSPFSAVLLLLS